MVKTGQPEELLLFIKKPQKALVRAGKSHIMYGLTINVTNSVDNR